ncbi:MAG: HDIG domain-containing protein [Chlorobiota bacterium]|nr:MAG: HDIG domain-containing protein [Chlorobiota bacterium]
MMAKPAPTLFEQYRVSTQSSEKLWYHLPTLRWSIIALSVVVTALFIPPLARFLWNTGTSSVPAPGFRWNGAPVIAEQTFPILKPPAVYRAECDSARQVAPLVYELEQPPLSSNDLFAAGQGHAALNLRWKGTSTLQVELARARHPLDSMFSGAIVVDTLVASRTSVVYLRARSSGAWYRVTTDALLLEREARRALERVLSHYGLPDSLGAMLLSSIGRLPRARYSPALSLQEQVLAVQNVRRTYGIVRQGETIVAPGELITTMVAAKLASYRDALAELQAARLTQSLLSSLVRALLLCGIIWLYLIVARTDQLDDNRTVITVAALLVLSALQSWLSTLLDAAYAPEFLVLLPAIAMLITLLYDVRLAFVFALSAALLHAAIRSGDLPSGLSLLVASLAGVISVRTLQSRYQFIRSILFIAVGFWLSLLAALLEGGITLSLIGSPAAAATVNAIVSPLLVWIALLVLDRIFDVPTDVRLLQLDTLTHPLLVKLRQVAPGTYQHTLNVANLAEHAAIAIGANPLLARVGAYFHDIGKIRKPEYFAENQIELANKHRELSPWRSAAIIRAHVEEGVELALEYRLPPKVVEFIPTHHGTSLIRHFYAQALDEARMNNQPVDEGDFRYGGPKPRTKETGVVMLADISEAIARVAESPKDIEERLERVFREKIDDGQLDECPLTLREITSIRALFADLLIGMVHQRPDYKTPEPESVPASAAQPPPAP